MVDLKRLLADQFFFYWMSHTAHWNITGPDFHDKHEFLKDIYEDAFAAVDDVAERMRVQGDFVPGTFNEMASFRTLRDPGALKVWSYVRDELINGNNALIASLNDACAQALSANDQGLVNFLADRLDRQGKLGWMLKSS